MNSKKYLEHISQLNNKINRKIDELTELREIAENPGCMNYGERVKSSSEQDKLGIVVDKIVTLEKVINGLTDIYIDMKITAIKIVDQMENNKRAEIIRNVYLLPNNKTVYELSNSWNCDYSNLKKEHKKALCEFGEILDIVVEKK